MTQWDGNERRIETITMDKIENCVYKALAKFKKEEKQEAEENLRLHQAECPAFQGQKLVKWFVSLPIISTIAIVVFHYFTKGHGTK